MKQEITLGLNDADRLVAISKALSSYTRIDMLKRLIDRAMSISEIAEAFYLPASSASMHVKMLEDAGLITLSPKPGLRGTKKLCGIKTSQVLLDLFQHRKNFITHPYVIENMPVGNFSDCEVFPPCGLASEESYLAFEDSPHGFYSAKRNQASLLWISKGYVEYKLSNRALNESDVLSVELSFEICSEALGYNNDWPSDVTLWINNNKITTFLIKGDYGDHRGAQNPNWWSDSLTQYGELKTLMINDSACYLNNKKVSGHTLQSLAMKDDYFFRLKIGIEEDAVHSGGINLFGEKFGDYPQDILMKVAYRN